jgi:hypothetical protein
MPQSFALTLYTSVMDGNASFRHGDVTARMKKTWQRSIRAVGGYWLGTADYEGSIEELLEMFAEGMLREVRESVGGMLTWQGYIAQMELTLNGVTFTRSLVDVYNAVKAIYTRLGDNLLSNGSAESGAWTVYNGATVTQSTVWVSDGLYSCLISDADGNPAAPKGARISGAGYALTIVAGAAYEIQVKVNVVSGSWRVSVNRSDTDAALAADSTHGAVGEKVFNFTIPAANTYAGTVDFRITSEAALHGTGSIYGDGAYFELAPVRAETNWKTDADSIAMYGRMENVLLDVAEVWSQAAAHATTSMKKSAWPRLVGQNEFATVDPQTLGSTPNKLSLLLHGYVHTLANKYVQTTQPALGQAADTQVRSVISEAEFVTAGGININTVTFQIDNRAPIRHWQVLSDIIAMGDAAGNRWIGGVGAGRLFHYQQADGLVWYHYRGGKYYNSAGGELEPWFAKPSHLLYLDDSPVGPTQISGNVEDDPHVQYVAEVEMGPATEDFPNGTLIMRHEVTG